MGISSLFSRDAHRTQPRAVPWEAEATKANEANVRALSQLPPVAPAGAYLPPAERARLSDPTRPRGPLQQEAARRKRLVTLGYDEAIAEKLATHPNLVQEISDREEDFRRWAEKASPKEREADAKSSNPKVWDRGAPVVVFRGMTNSTLFDPTRKSPRYAKMYVCSELGHALTFTRASGYVLKMQVPRFFVDGPTQTDKTTIDYARVPRQDEFVTAVARDLALLGDEPSVADGREDAFKPYTGPDFQKRWS